MYTVKQLADLAHISVRTLHHYDHIDLLKPSIVLDNGYRQYSDKELYVLQQILFFKELEFSLEEIKAIMYNDQFDPIQALQDHKCLLIKKKDRLERLVKTIDYTLEEMKGERVMSKKELYGHFTKAEMEQYKEEVKQKYDERYVLQSEERTQGWNESDYQTVMKQYEDIMTKMKELIEEQPDHPSVQIQVARIQDYCSQFYDCNLEILSGLGDLYVQDERFKKYFEQYHPHLAVFVRDAIKQYVKMKTE